MPASTEAGPLLAVVAPEDVDATHCVTGTVVVDRHKKDVRTLHAQVRYMTVLQTADQRRLRVSAHIADGTWASVYHVCEMDSSRFSALKVIPVEGSNVDSAYDNIELLRRLPHRNVVQYYSHFTLQVNGVRCLCIELEVCDNGTLISFLRVRAKHAWSMSVARVQDFASQLSCALAYIHDQGFLHGDLRPESVLVTADKVLKLTNFGSPRWMERSGLPRTITGGCKAYAPPEWMDSELPHRKLRAWETPLASYDMWSLGCVLSELVTLKLLRNDRHHWGTALASDPADLQGVSQEVAATHDGLFSPLLERLLDTDPEARMTASEALTELRGLHPRTTIPLVQLCMPFTRVITTPWA
eukprot:GGOE01011270.1.p1 GENE.GGOE01011270.1~~GGOE01011270.1.p1  ORF type:complete len:367 (-),score=112.84 GGOE01011270.1:754-1821(-)